MTGQKKKAPALAAKAGQSQPAPAKKTRKAKAAAAATVPTPSRRAPARRPRQAVIIDALRRAHGMVAIAAVHLGVARGTLSRWISQSDTLKEAVQDARAMMLDTAETRLIQHLNAPQVVDKETGEVLLRGAPWAVGFVLKTIGKERGYIERHEHIVDAGDVKVMTDEELERIVAGDASANTRK